MMEAAHALTEQANGLAGSAEYLRNFGRDLGDYTRQKKFLGPRIAYR